MSVADSGTSSRRFGGGSWRVWLLGNRPVTSAHPELFDAVCMSWLAGPVPHRVAMDTAALIPEDVPIVAGGHGPSGGAEWYRANLREAGLVEVVEGVGHSDVLGIDCDVDPDERAPTTTDIGRVCYSMVRTPGCRPTDRVWPVLSARGCPGKCTFCYRLSGGWRPRNIALVEKEIRWLVKEHGITYIQLQDECALASPKRAEAICEMFSRLRMDVLPELRWSTQAMVGTLARAPKLAQRLADAGCVFVNVGIESMEPEALKLCGKKHSPTQAKAALTRLHDVGVSAGINLMWPLPGDTLESLEAAVNLIIGYTDYSQLRTIRPPTPWPGSKLWYDAVEAGHFMNVGDFYQQFRCSDLCSVSYIEGKAPRDVDHHLCLANRVLLGDYYTHAKATAMEQARRLYYEWDGGEFRGWRQV